MENFYKKGKNWVIETYLDDSLLKSLTKELDKNIESVPINTEYSPIQGQNSVQHWIYDKKSGKKFFNEEFESLMNKLKDYSKELMIKYDIVGESSVEFDGVWSIIGGENSYCQIHDHPNINGVSVVLYLRVPQHNSDHFLDQTRGQIYFVLDCETATEDFSSKVVEINPDVGKILIFPNWMLHGTYPQLDGIRQTLNTNLSI